MKAESYVLIGVLLIALVGLGFTLKGFLAVPGQNSNALQSTVSDGNNNQGAYGTKTSEGEVTIDLTPKGFENGNFAVEISIDTHTVDLSPFDLKKLARLEYNGKSIAPLSAPSLSGHHNSGKLVFSTGEEPKAFRIVIKGIPDAEERNFQW